MSDDYSNRARAAMRMYQAAVSERDALISERDEWKEKVEFFIVQYQDEIGINGLKEERDAAIAERDALRQALGDIIKLCPKVLHGERDVVDIAEIAHSALKGGDNQGAEVAAAMQDVAKRGIIKGGDNG